MQQKMVASVLLLYRVLSVQWKGKKPTVNKTSVKLHDAVLQNISVGRSYAGVSRCISFIDCFFTTWGQRNKH